MVLWPSGWAGVEIMSKSGILTQDIEMFKARCTTTKHMLKPWQEVKYRQSLESKHAKRRKGHNLNASQSTKLVMKIQNRHQHVQPLQNPNINCQHFSHPMIGRNVIEALSSRRCFNMPTHCSSDVGTTNCRDQAGSPSK